MLVRDLGDGYQIVCQPDHGSVAGQLAAAWEYGTAIDAELREALIVAATRHDDGWSVWERHPRIGDDGRPQNFLDAPVAPLLSSYTAAADVVQAENPLAGLLVSMHVSGLRRSRYGVFAAKPTGAADELTGPVREFVTAEEERQRRLAASLSLERPLWAYRLLQVFDVFSLHLGLDAGSPTTIDAPPVNLRPGGAPPAAGQTLRISPTGPAWELVCEPYPFASNTVNVGMVRRVVPGRRWDGDEDFRAAFAAAAPESVTISLGPARS